MEKKTIKGTKKEPTAIEVRHATALAKLGHNEETWTAKRGRKSLFRDFMYDEGPKLAALGLTMQEIADFWDVNRATLNRWAKRRPDFRAALKRGKVKADTNVVKSLFKRAVGYRYTEIHYKETVITEGKRAGEVVRYKEKEVVKEMPPDPTSIIFWEKNRQPEKWKDDRALLLTGDKDGTPVPIQFVEVASKNSGGNSKKKKKAKAPTGAGG